jgi:maleate isomerase
VRRLALVTPYIVSVTQALEEYVAEVGITVTGRAHMGLIRHIWKAPYRDVVDMARRAVRAPADALFGCTGLPTYDVIPQREAELRMPVISANQVTMWAALRHLGTRAVGPIRLCSTTSLARAPYCRKKSSRKAGHDSTRIPLPGPLRRGRLPPHRAAPGQ